MANVSVSLPADGSTGTVSQYNTPITSIVNTINGGLDNSNIAAAAAIATSKLADDGGITGAKIANYKVIRQNDTTNITEATARILTGWGVMVTPSGGSSWFETVTFGSAFTSPPIVLISAGGDTLSTANTTYGQGGSLNVAGWTCKAHTINASSFVAYLSTSTGANITTSGTVFYQWIAIGI